MIRRALFSRMAFPSLTRGMDVSELRRQVSSENIANALTPGYRARRVAFEEELQRQQAPGSNAVSMRATGAGHLPVSPELVEPRIRPSEDPILPNGTNNVDIEREMAMLGWNRVQMSALTQFATRQYRLIRDAIGYQSR